LPRRPARVLGQPRGCQRLPVRRSLPHPSWLSR
jgi:hypothetical protein